MSDCIPFVNSEADCRILKKYFNDARACRVPLNSIDKLRSYLPDRTPLWIDPAVDAYHHFYNNGTSWPFDVWSESPTDIRAKWPRDNRGTLVPDWKFKLWDRWERQFNQFHGYRLLTHEKCWQKKYEPDLDIFVAEVLNACLVSQPTWISLPQLPVGKGRTRVNRRLSEATGIWKRDRPADVRLILPLIVTTASVLGSKPSRDNTLKAAIECYGTARADGIWVVDTSLTDQYRNERYPLRYEKLIKFHEGLREALPRQAIVIGGPYWGINLVLWARGLCDFPATSLGTTYTYHIPCGQPTQGSVRISIPPLKRWVLANADLAGWLDDVLRRLDRADNVYAELAELRRNFQTFMSKDAAVEQVAGFFKRWFSTLESVSPEGRSLALYQNLSSAFVLGRQLPPLPKTVLPQAPAKVLEAGKVAEQLMLHCL